MTVKLSEVSDWGYWARDNVAHGFHTYPILFARLPKAEANARRVNPHLAIFRVSATSGDGLSAWLDWIEAGLEAQRARHGESIDALKARIAELERQLAAR